jgi:hypothetical protein
MKTKIYEDWQNRVILEKLDLDEKLMKLEVFLESDPKGLPTDALVMLDRQFRAMRDYSNILAERIASFG